MAGNQVGGTVDYQTMLNLDVNDNPVVESMIVTTNQNNGNRRLDVIIDLTHLSIWPRVNGVPVNGPFPVGFNPANIEGFLSVPIYQAGTTSFLGTAIQNDGMYATRHNSIIQGNGIGNVTVRFLIPSAPNIDVSLWNGFHGVGNVTLRLTNVA